MKMEEIVKQYWKEIHPYGSTKKINIFFILMYLFSTLTLIVVVANIFIKTFFEQNNGQRYFEIMRVLIPFVILPLFLMSYFKYLEYRRLVSFGEKKRLKLFFSVMLGREQENLLKYQKRKLKMIFDNYFINNEFEDNYSEINEFLGRKAKYESIIDNKNIYLVLLSLFLFPSWENFSNDLWKFGGWGQLIIVFFAVVLAILIPQLLIVLNDVANWPKNKYMALENFMKKHFLLTK